MDDIKLRLEYDGAQFELERRIDALRFANVWPEERYNRDDPTHRAAVATINKMKWLIIQILRDSNNKTP